MIEKGITPGQIEVDIDDIVITCTGEGDNRWYGARIVCPENHLYHAIVGRGRTSVDALKDLNYQCYMMYNKYLDWKRQKEYSESRGKHRAAVKAAGGYWKWFFSTDWDGNPK